LLTDLEGKGEKEKGHPIETLIQAVRKACHHKDSEAHRNALWRATAMLIKTPGT
jgi:hypothetical protein